jgi:hypothetical protein
VAFAAAAVALVAVAGSAFAAPSALPDNPLYPVKQIEEQVRLALAPSNERLPVQLQLANERLREAEAMAANHQPRLAENSLRAFTLILDGAAVSLKNPANPQATKDALLALRANLDAVERVNANRNDDVAGIKQLVTAAGDELDRIEHQDSVTAPVLVIGEQATPEPTPKATPTPKPTPKPKPTDDGGDHRNQQH